MQLALDDTDESSVGSKEEGKTLEHSEEAKKREVSQKGKQVFNLESYEYFSLTPISCKMLRVQKRFQHRGKKLLDLTGKRYLGKSADDLLTHGSEHNFLLQLLVNLCVLVTFRSRLYENKEARDAFLKEIKDASVEFLLSYLPTMQVHEDDILNLA